MPTGKTLTGERFKYSGILANGLTVFFEKPNSNPGDGNQLGRHSVHTR